MAVQPLRQQDNRNPRTRDEALALVRHVEALFMPWNVDALADGFTEDCIVRFGSVPEFTGREAVRAFFRTRSARQNNYRLAKQLRSFAGDTITNSWIGTWQDTESGAPMKGFGVEVWVLRDGKIALWEAAFNVGRADQTSSVADALR
jgi:nuclear transport factor 2 (NTF2) superfamily protein